MKETERLFPTGIVSMISIKVRTIYRQLQTPYLTKIGYNALILAAFLAVETYDIFQMELMN